jgi:hypothetical protein
MRAKIILTMALAGVAMGGSGCRTKPEVPHTWVAFHVTIEPLGQKGEWSAEETGLIKDSVEGAAKSFGLKRKRAYKLPDLIGWKDTTDCYLAWFTSNRLEIKAYYLSARPRNWTPPDEAEKRGPILVDFVYQKTSPITEAELQKCEKQWEAVYEPLNARFADRLKLVRDVVRKREEE